LLRLFNSLGKKLERFPYAAGKPVTMFTCGPSVYQKAHIGNFRTFAFEDIVVRYLEYLGCTVTRGMNLTDIEDKAIAEARVKGMSVRRLTEHHIREFLGEMKALRIKVPDYLPRASECVPQAVALIKKLLDMKRAYWHGGNVYFAPLSFPGFGKLYGLDMSRWPATTRRFHRDTYPGMQWNLGDFILWHGYRPRDTVSWESDIGRGRPSWNIQDPSMIAGCFNKTLSVYCGGIDNLFRHHDYTLAVLESVRPFPMARFWLHCHHLHVRGQKMSKSKGNICYPDDLFREGYGADEVRFFLIYAHYRQELDYSPEALQAASEKLRALRAQVRRLSEKAGTGPVRDRGLSRRIEQAFREHMDNELDVKTAVDALSDVLTGGSPHEARPGEARLAVKTLREIDGVLRVIF
jgi:cysteinyl-tRNA synthetase